MRNASNQDTRKFPISMITDATYCEATTRAIRKAFPSRHGRKDVARLLGVSARTVSNWFAGLNAPRGAELLRLMQSNDAIAAEIFALVGKTDVHEDN